MDDFLERTVVDGGDLPPTRRVTTVTGEPRTFARIPVGSRGEVLVVRTHPERDEALDAWLVDAGYTLVVRGPGSETDSFFERPPALIVADVPAGDVSVLEHCSKVTHGLSQFAPAVLAVTEDDEAQLERAFALGATDVITRPVSPALLRVKVQRHARRPTPVTSIGGYVLEKRLGRGGMGTVYLAEKKGLKVALKTLELAAAVEPETVVRFHREIEVLRRLDAPGIPKLLDAGRTEQGFFYCMEYVPGPSLYDIVAQRGALSQDEVVRLIDDVACALEVIHDAGLVHRDVKPGNVIVQADGHAKLIDYGLAKRLDDSGLTRTNEVVGTLLYVAPELLRGAPASPATDTYALGMTALEAAVGRRLFDGSGFTVAERIARGNVPRAEELLPGSDDRLVGVLDGLACADPELRLELPQARAYLRPLRR